MSEFLSHECGIALVRLKKPLGYYQEKYGTPLWGFYQLFLLMEKQHNRGQDGAGVACVKFDVPAGEPYMFRERNVETNPLDKIFQSLLARYNALVAEGAVHPERFRSGLEVLALEVLERAPTLGFLVTGQVHLAVARHHLAVALDDDGRVVAVAVG